MRKLLVAAIASSLLAVFAEQSLAMQLDVNVDTELTCADKFLWRGSVFSDDWNVQPSVRIDLGYFSLAAIGYWLLVDPEEGTASERTRVDITTDFSVKHNRYTTRFGFIGYIYTDTSPEVSWKEDTYEVFAAFDSDISPKNDKEWIILLPKLAVYFDVGENGGLYGTVGFANIVSLFSTDEWSGALDIRADIGLGNEKHNDRRFSFEAPEDGSVEPYDQGSSLVDFSASASIPFFFGENTTFTPAVRYMSLVDPDIKDAVKYSGKETDGVAYSFSIGASF